MREIPILFTGDNVRLILAGVKTQTRRIVKRQSVFNETLASCKESPTGFAWSNGWVERCQYGSHGDRLWVKETHRFIVDERLYDCVQYRADMSVRKPVELSNDVGFKFSHDCENSDGKWRPSIFMPRWASRITLDNAGVRVQRLQDISETDAIAEGVRPLEEMPGPAGPNKFSITHENMSFNAPTARGVYAMLWDAINEQRGFAWDDNPWVWVIEFLPYVRQAS